MACRIIASLDEVAADYDAILCDLWGCYHNGIAYYPAAADACRRFRERGGTVILLTNAPRPAASVERLLAGMRAPRDSWDAIVSSGGACQAAVADGSYGRHFAYVGPDRDLHMLTDLGKAPVPADRADAILLTGLRDDRVETPDDYSDEIADWVERGLPVLCANPDIVVDRGDARLWCAGAIARRAEEVGGQVVWFGKPHAPVYDRCRAVVADLRGAPVPDSRILALGDGIATDVPGGLNAGLDVVFVTGGLSSADFGPDVEQPEPEPLDRFLGEIGLAPKYAIGRLR